MDKVKIAVVYVFASVQPQIYEPYARRFAQQYVKHPPGVTDHELHVVVNGPKITPHEEAIFSPLVPNYMYHDSSGKDVGAHRLAARVIPCDLIIFLGGPCWPGKPMWLDRIANVYEEFGPALYGNYCFHAPAPHVRTTFYWGPPHIFNSHTLPVHNDLRYMWEHGQESITRHCFKLGFPVYQVTWSGVYSIEHWRHVEEQDCLCFDQHTERLSYGYGW